MFFKRNYQSDFCIKICFDLVNLLSKGKMLLQSAVLMRNSFFNRRTPLVIRILFSSNLENVRFISVLISL